MVCFLSVEVFGLLKNATCDTRNYSSVLNCLSSARLFRMKESASETIGLRKKIYKVSIRIMCLWWESVPTICGVKDQWPICLLYYLPTYRGHLIVFNFLKRKFFKWQTKFIALRWARTILFWGKLLSFFYLRPKIGMLHDCTIDQ